MARRRKHSPEGIELGIDMTPMIDVTFQLIIFFILSLKFKVLERKLDSYLPTDFGSGVHAKIIDESFITVKLRQPPKTVDQRPILKRDTVYQVEAETVGGAASEIEAKVLARLDRFIKSAPDAKGKIEAGLGVPHERVVRVLDLFHKAGYKEITFTGLDRNDKIDDGWYARIMERLKD